jgi:hypothetical protein
MIKIKWMIDEIKLIKFVNKLLLYITWLISIRAL